MLRSLISVLALLFVSTTATGAPEYFGTIDGTTRIGMRLVATEAEAVGYCYLPPDFSDHELKGKIEQRHIRLEKRDAAGKLLLRLEGDFVEQDPQGRFKGGKLNREVLVGTWSVGEGRGKPLYLGLQHDSDTVPTKLEPHVYEAAVQRFWKAVQQNDRQTVASMMRYPCRVQVGGGAGHRIDSANVLLSRYDAIFHVAFRRKIAQAIPHHLYGNYQGFMLGNGLVWFDEDGHAFSLNN